MDRPSEVNAFSSKHDLTFTGMAKMAKMEQRGYALFRGKGRCALCHIANGQEALFTDFTFDNLGLPKNPENPATVADPDFADPGLGGFLMNAGYLAEVYEADWGKGIVHFYNTRDVKEVCPGDYTEAEALASDCWPEPEVPMNVNRDELGDLGLTAEEEAAIVAFLRALSDGFQP